MTVQNRQERKKAELRREIIDATFECFAESGYHNTGIADIALRLGIGHGTFYRYFANKRDIIDHVISDLIAQVTAALANENRPEAATTLGAYRRQVATIGDSLIEIFGQDTRIARILLFEATTVDEELRQRVFGLLDTAAAMTAAYLRHGVDAGYLRKDLDVLNTARAINGAILAAIIENLRAPHEQNLHRFSDAIQRLMYDGITEHTQDATRDDG